MNTVPFSPSPEAMEEVRVISGSYSAEYGFNSGAQLVMVMRSGTNDFHGSAYDFLRNEKLDAEGYFPELLHSRRTAARQEDFATAESVWRSLGRSGPDSEDSTTAGTRRSSTSTTKAAAAVNRARSLLLLSRVTRCALVTSANC